MTLFQFRTLLMKRTAKTFSPPPPQGSRGIAPQDRCSSYCCVCQPLALTALCHIGQSSKNVFRTTSSYISAALSSLIWKSATRLSSPAAWQKRDGAGHGSPNYGLNLARETIPSGRNDILSIMKIYCIYEKFVDWIECNMKRNSHIT